MTSQNRVNLDCDVKDDVLGVITKMIRCANEKGLNGVKITNMRLVRQPSKPFAHESYLVWDEE